MRVRFFACYIERGCRDGVAPLAGAPASNLCSYHCGGRWSGSALQMIAFSTHNASRRNDEFFDAPRLCARERVLMFSIRGLDLTIVVASVSLEGTSHRFLSWFFCDNPPVCLTAEMSFAMEKGEARTCDDHACTYIDRTKCEDATSTVRSAQTFSRRTAEDLFAHGSSQITPAPRSACRVLGADGLHTISWCALTVFAFLNSFCNSQPQFERRGAHLFCSLID